MITHMSTMRSVDPELVEALSVYDHRDLGAHNVTTVVVPGAPGPLSSDVTRSDWVIPGDPDVSVRIHRPSHATGPLPCLVSMHAGGYVVGDPTMDDHLLDHWCRTLGIVAVSVDYRLAPAHCYPAPLMDCYAALTWIYEQADLHRIDRARIGVHGIGAGGGLAAALAGVARDHRDIPLAFQLLDSPMLDDRQQTPSSRRDDLLVWSAQSNEFGWRAYLGDLYGSEDLPVYAAAARNTRLRGLPPCFISVGALDGFHDEDVDYATRLNHAGVPTELHVYPRTPHGYRVAVTSDVARRAERDQTDWLRRQLTR